MGLKPIFELVKRYSLPILAAGFISNCTPKVDEATIERLVAEAYEKEAKKFRSEFIIVCNDNNQPAVIPDAFSKSEKFKSSSLSDSFLKSKIGFKYEVDEKVYKKIVPDAPDIGLFYESIGTDYVFSVEDNYPGVHEILQISNYTGETFASSTIVVHDNNHDNVPDYIRVIDSKNNTGITIRRSLGGVIDFENVDESGARKLFDLYSAKYVDFKIKNRIDELILAYEPKLEIREISP